MRPHLAQAGQGVFQLREFDLQTGLVRAGTGRKDVENQLAAIEDFDFGCFFETADLRGRQIIVEDDDIGIGWRPRAAVSSSILPLPMYVPG